MMLQFFFQKLVFIVNTVDSSSKRHDELHDAQMDELARSLAVDDLEIGQGANQICSLKRPGETRWGSHFGSVASLMDVLKSCKLSSTKFSCRFINWSKPCQWRYCFQQPDIF